MNASGHARRNLLSEDAAGQSYLEEPSVAVASQHQASGMHGAAEEQPISKGEDSCSCLQSYPGGTAPDESEMHAASANVTCRRRRTLCLITVG